MWPPPDRIRRRLAALTIVAILFLVVTATVRSPQSMAQFRSFSSYDQMSSFILQRAIGYESYLGQSYGPITFERATLPSAATLQPAKSYTTANVQVEGVDEPDIVKTDGSYVYAVSQNKVFIILADPPELTRIVARLEHNGPIEGIFLSQDRLVVMGTGSAVKPEQDSYQDYGVNFDIYDISDKSKPTVVKDIFVAGTYVNSRLIAGYVYVIVQQMAVQSDAWGNLRVPPPTIQEGRTEHVLPPSKVYYNPSSQGPVNIYTLVLAVKASDGASNTISVLTGYASTIYASLSNIYITFPDSPIIYLQRGIVAPLVGGLGNFAALWGGYRSDTTVFRVTISGPQLAVAVAGSVPGQILNQFSMDEHNGYFRVATTNYRTPYGGNPVQVNNIYVLDGAMKIIGSLEGLAAKERIYAVRFMANRGYVVTFEKVDPLFAISLDDPTQPKLLNALHMPGFSQYLHPIGNGYLIGVGKDAVAAEQGDFAWYQGLKLSLFHANQEGNLTEVAKLLIGDRGSDSPVLYDHRAFMYDPARAVMALPLLVTHVNKEVYVGPPPPNTYGTPIWQGAYVFQVTPRGFQSVSKITHIPNGQPVGEAYGLYVSRVLLLGDFTYTLSERMLKVNSISNMENVSTIQLT